MMEKIKMGPSYWAFFSPQGEGFDVYRGPLEGLHIQSLRGLRGWVAYTRDDDPIRLVESLTLKGDERLLLSLD